MEKLRDQCEDTVGGRGWRMAYSVGVQWSCFERMRVRMLDGRIDESAELAPELAAVLL